jgi:alpha-galactosidase
MNEVRIGGWRPFADDIRIPLKYGVDQCVGDTICAGRHPLRPARHPAMLDFCRDISEVAERRARCCLNYANPMAMMTWAAIEHGRVNTVGLCQGAERPIDQSRGAQGPMEELDSSARATTINWYIDIPPQGGRIG